MKDTIAIFWFRRDLRLDDNHGFYKALIGDYKVLPIFIFDSEILNELPKDDARVSFIYDTLNALNKTLKTKWNSQIHLFYGTPIDVYKQIVKDYNVASVFTNHDYEPYAKQRDEEIKIFLKSKRITFLSFKDQVVFEKNEVSKADGTPYLVYTPYLKAWKNKFKDVNLKPFPSKNHLNNLISNIETAPIELKDIGFKPSSQTIAPYELNPSLIQNYEALRNFPAKHATSRIGPHLRFGTISIRKTMKQAISETNEIFWQELIWREFFMQILWHFPNTTHDSFKPKYDRIVWRNNNDEFKLWCEGKTGYPLVDAGMRELNETGFVHNRVRMLVGSFLCKHLLIDWRWGEAYFAKKLHDYEMASNIGNWQWVAGCGVDAAPYFRIFNPTTQIKKFDKDLKYIKRWIPEFDELTYPNPIVDHKFARERCLNTYKVALNN
ncbi:deoxyribodipyrimidine photo-lyase [Tamlana fucoidanivorans]|uniref:Deoxyribodipyrimidine photo-lyase n=1 Tax=Allotamlana fucoidanivorans TaxID=2583814 RepID=A0A5C4SI52_9FLAO|nr:deoxyribodipyrimidine photo-lyase [Tamlana fucoidanivorans]TNJ42462.1 deoxyribodipyrimidine photo-lyase [Tamlana fucoidanivorans]